MRTSILIACDGEIAAEGLRALLETRAQLDVVGIAQSRGDAVEQAVAKRPDLALIEPQLPGDSGLEALRQIREQSPETRCVVMLAGPSASLVRRVLRLGASGVVERRSGLSELLHAIDAASARRNYVAPSLGACVVDLLSGTDSAQKDHPTRLSRRQREVLELIAEGLSTSEIAGTLGISIKTAQTHRAKLMDRVNVHKVSSLVRYAIREGVVEV